MAENPYVNKVIYGDQTLIDLTDDTVSPSSLKLGSTAHDASGAQITGTADDAPKRTLAYIFDSSDSYAVSDYVYYEDKLYRCIVAHSGTWNSEHFVETTIGDELNDKMAEMTILSYGKSTWNDFLTAYTGNKVVYCRASSNANPATGSQTRLAFMAYVNNETNPTNVEFQYYRSVVTHTDVQQGDQVFVYKLDKTAGWTVTTRNAFTKIAAGTGLSGSFSNGVLTLSNNTPAPAVVSKTADGLAPQLPDESTTTKFLRQDGTWAEPSSGSNVKFVTITVNKSPYSCTADKTYQEIKAGLDNGEIYFALINGDYFTGTKPLVWNLDGYNTSSICFSRRNIDTSSSSYDVSIAYEHVLLHSDGTATTTITYDPVAKPVNFRGYLRLICNDDYYYQDNPSGTFRIEYSDDFYTMESVYSAISSRFSEDVRLVYGQVDNYSPPAKYEIYHLAEATYEEVDPEEQGYGIPKYTLVFKVLSEKNGVPVLKKVTAVGVDTDEQWDGIGIGSNYVTVTYSEIPLGAPPSASGVSF